MARYRALEVQLRDAITETQGCSGTVAERMVQWFRARLDRFLASVMGHALLSVKSDIGRELSNGRRSDSTTVYCTGTPYGERTCLTDYCMCTASHVPRTVQNRQSNTTAVITAGMISTTVGAVLQKCSTQWHIRSLIHSRWLCWRGRCLRTARQMAVRAVAKVAAAEGTAAEGAAAEGAVAEQICTPDSSGYSVQPMASFASVHRAYQQHWSVVSLSEENYQEHLFGDARQLTLARVAAMTECQQALRQLQEAKAQDSATGTGTPMQILAQYHPSDAMAFEQAAQGTPATETKERIKGFVKISEDELCRRKLSTLTNVAQEHSLATASIVDFLTSAVYSKCPIPALGKHWKHGKTEQARQQRWLNNSGKLRLKQQLY